MGNYTRKPLNEGYQKTYNSSDRDRAPAPHPQTPRDGLATRDRQARESVPSSGQESKQR